MKGLVATPFITISREMSSHRAAQGVIYADQLNNAGYNCVVNMTRELYVDDFNDFDTLFVYHGNDFSGAVNLFGGLDNFPYIDNFVNFSTFRGDVYSLAIDMPDYFEIMKEKFDKAREKNKSWNPAWNGIDWNNLKRMCETAKKIVPNELEPYPRLSVGDSHAICMYRPRWQNLSVPFKTLFGALKEGLDSFVAVKQSYETIEFYFGNIDVRHHLCRQEDPESATRQLVVEYFKQAVDIAKTYECTVRLYELLPIENESRSIPKTGWYKGTPFYGSWAQRNAVRKIFKQELKKLCAQTDGKVVVYEWIGDMINTSNELDFRCMERPQSVHLSREWYPHWQGYEYSMLVPREYVPRPENENIMSLESFFE